MTIEQGKIIEETHTHCMVCGQSNHRSLKMKFTTDANGRTHAQFQGDNSFQGYKGILHGGIITTLLDAAMTHCLFDHGVIALTGDLRVRFVHPIDYNALLSLHANIVEIKKSMYLMKAEALYQSKVMAWAEAKFIQTTLISI